MFREIDPEKITIACKTCGEIFHSVEALENHRRSFWNRIGHMALLSGIFGRYELDMHKTIYYAGHEVLGNVLCGAHSNEYIPTKDTRSFAYLIEEGETHD